MMATASIMASPIHRDHHFVSQSPQQAYSNERSRPFNYTTPALVTQNLPHTSPSMTTPSAFQKPGAMQSPPSPPADDSSKPSLPSISSLLSMTGKEQRQDSPVQQHAASQSVASQQSFHYPQSRSVPSTPSEYRPVSHSQGYMDHRGAPLGVTLPPTPPLGPDSEGQPSPSVYSSHSAYPPSPFHVTHKQPPPLLRTTSSTSVYTTSSFAQSPFPSSASAYFPSHSVSAQPVGIYAQRPLPSNFPPPMHIQSLGSQVAPNPWQHHHYISASSQSAFPQPPDRYVCPTCNKAFSRPSSLRIHSHSHTGEKPFKCSHIGCGKAFSVRSNMKRHERGCHAAGGSGSTSS